jgi:hypothetical protein
MVKKSLKDYTNEELFEILENNERTPSSDLAFFSSELLRRQIFLYKSYKDSINNMSKKWIKLFHNIEISWLEETLNRFIQEHESCDITTWNNERGWYAQVVYTTYTEPPKDAKPPHEEES